jgi:hypothetical protein
MTWNLAWSRQKTILCEWKGTMKGETRKKWYKYKLTMRIKIN